MLEGNRQKKKKNTTKQYGIIIRGVQILRNILFEFRFVSQFLGFFSNAKIY